MTADQIEYNKLLMRYEKAVDYFEKETIPQEKKLIFLEDFQKILMSLSVLMAKIENMTDEEVLKGFI